MTTSLDQLATFVRGNILRALEDVKWSHSTNTNNIIVIQIIHVADMQIVSTYMATWSTQCVRLQGSTGNWWW